MPVDQFPNKTIQELEALLAQAQDRLINGQLTEVSGAGIRTVRDSGKTTPPERLIEMIKYSLYLRAIASGDEELIKAWPDPRVARVNRSRTRYL